MLLICISGMSIFLVFRFYKTSSFLESIYLINPIDRITGVYKNPSDEYMSIIIYPVSDTCAFVYYTKLTWWEDIGWRYHKNASDIIAYVRYDNVLFNIILGNISLFNIHYDMEASNNYNWISLTNVKYYFNVKYYTIHQINNDDNKKEASLGKLFNMKYKFYFNSRIGHFARLIDSTFNAYNSQYILI